MDSLLNQGDLTSQEGATFGEYQVTTKKHGAESQSNTNLDIIGTSNESMGGFQTTTTNDFNSQYAGQSQSDEVTFGEYKATGNSQSNNDYLQTSTERMETLPAKFLPPITQGGNDIQSALVSSSEINKAETNTPIPEGLAQDTSVQEATFGEYQTTTTTTATTDFNISPNSNVKFSSILPTKVLPTIIQGENEAQFNQSSETNQFQTEINQEFQAETSGLGSLENIQLNIDTNTIQETKEGTEFATTNHIEGIELQNSQGDDFSFPTSKEQVYNENTENLVSGGYETNTGLEETQFNFETTTDVTATNNEFSNSQFNSVVNAYTGEESGQSNIPETNIDTTGGFDQFEATTITGSGLESTQFAAETKVDTGATFNQYNIEDTINGMDSNQYTNETTVDSNLQFGQLEEAATTNDTALNAIPFQIAEDTANAGATMGQFEETSITNDSRTYGNQIQTEGKIIAGFDTSSFPTDGATIDISKGFGETEIASTITDTGFDATQFTTQSTVNTDIASNQLETANETGFDATQFTGEATAETGASFQQFEATTTNETGFDATQFTGEATVDTGSAFGQFEGTTTNETGFDATQFTGEATVDTGSAFGQFEATTKETGFDATQFTGETNIDTGSTFQQFEATTTNETGFDATQFKGEATVDTGSSFGQFEATTTNETGFDTPQLTTDANINTGATFGQFDTTTTNVAGFDANQFTGEGTVDTVSSFGQFEGNITNETGFDATQSTGEAIVDTGSAFGKIEGTTTNETGFDAAQFTGETTVDTGSSFRQLEGTTTNETGFDTTQFTGEATATVDNGSPFGQFEATAANETGFDATQFTGEATADAGLSLEQFKATTTNETGFDATQFTGEATVDTEFTTENTFQQAETTIDNNFNLKELDINALQANTKEVPPSFNTNEFQTNTVEEATPSLDINVLQATATEDSIPSFDVKALQSTATEEAVIPYDINALQSEVNNSTHAFEATKYVNTSSLIDTTSTLQETPSTYPLINETSALPTFSGNEGYIGLDSNAKEYSAQSNTNENTFQEYSTTIKSSSNLTPKVVEEAGATFGEYQITKKDQSQYTNQINASSETTLKSANNFIQSKTFQESRVPPVPTMAGFKLPNSTINTTTKFSSSKKNDKHSFAKVTPLKGSFAVSRKNKIVGNAYALPYITKADFDSSTYKPNLRANFMNNGAQIKSNSLSQTSEYKATTYKPKSHY